MEFCVFLHSFEQITGNYSSLMTLSRGFIVLDQGRNKMTRQSDDQGDRLWKVSGSSCGCMWCILQVFVSRLPFFTPKGIPQSELLHKLLLTNGNFVPTRFWSPSVNLNSRLYHFPPLCRCLVLNTAMNGTLKDDRE